MSPRVFMDSRGQNKSFFFTSPLPFAENVTFGKCKLYWDFLVGLKKALAVRYLTHPKVPSPQFNTTNIYDMVFKESAGPERKAMSVGNAKSIAEIEQEDYNRALRGLENHQVILGIIKLALDAPGWPENDCAEPQQIVPSSDMQMSMHSSSKRSRDAVEELFTPPLSKRSAPPDYYFA